MSPELILFLKDNKDLINNAKTSDDWFGIYEKFESEYSEEIAGELSKVLLSIGVDPCKIIGVVPKRFLQGQKLDGYKIPENVTYIGAWAFEDTDLSIFQIPKGVTGLGYNSFSNTNLTEVILPDNVKVLKNAVFEYNRNLKKIDFGSVKQVGDWQCIGCINLEEVIIPNSVEYIDLNCFLNCKKLTKIIYKGTIKEWESFQRYYTEDWAIPIHCSDGVIK